MIPQALVAASTKPLILSILASRTESYGYEIIQLVKRFSGGHLQWSDGMLYPVLHRLERQGLIAARWGVSEAGRRRKYYQLQPEGAHALERDKQHWMQVHTTLMALWNLEPRLT